MRYNTEQEAKDALKESNEDFAKKMCPVFKTTCRFEECHSYCESGIAEKTGYVYTKQAKEHFFLVREAQCTCSTVTGVVVMEAE